MPQDSGFVNDPVCTATGHLLVDATDFAMPARLDVLSFRRLYASQDMADGAFGPGWWSWADARGGINAAGEFELVGPDARHATFAPDWRRRRSSRPRTSTSMPRADGDAQHLRWGRRSPYFGQTWVFERAAARGRRARSSGRPPSTTTAGRASSGSRTTAGARCSSCGRVAPSPGCGRATAARLRFRYDRRGHLVGVRQRGVAGDLRASTSTAGSCSITDADGIQMVAMTYDDDGRVVAQISQTGSDDPIRLRRRPAHDAVRRAHNPISVYTHDEQGRVEMYATAGGCASAAASTSSGGSSSSTSPTARRCA